MNKVSAKTGNMIKEGGENGKTEFVKAKENEPRATLFTLFFSLQLLYVSKLH